jgi:sterol desaturase/sphingolipid hydroxylase (fatty acid hydroxylase superfamily)
MSWEFVRDSAWQFTLTLWHVLPWMAAMGAVFSVLSLFMPCNPGLKWWRKKNLLTDFVFTRYLRVWLTVTGTMLLFRITDFQAIADFYNHGHGPLASLPLWLQAGIYLVGGDFVLYWSHRLFHRGFLWKYHAVHHAETQVEWISAARFHPVNLFLGSVAVDVAALLAGISPEIFIVIGPFNTIYSVFVHANLNWRLGRLKVVLVSPVFHRWHHANARRDVNFSSTFPVWDLMFGTFYLPEGILPDGYGIDDRAMPAGLVPQLLYPLLQE